MNDRSEKFFAWVWRLNGVLVLMLALIVLVGAFALLFNIGVFATRERPEQKLAEVAGANLTDKDLRLTDFYPIKGTSLLYARLAPPSEYIGSGSSGGQGPPNNLLFFDTATKKAHWLFPGNNQTISSFFFITDPPSAEYEFDDGNRGAAEPVTIAIVMEIQSSSNTQPTAGENVRSLAMATPDGRSITKVADSVDGMLGYHVAKKDSTFVFVIVGGAARVLHIDPSARVVLSDELLSTDASSVPPN